VPAVTVAGKDGAGLPVIVEAHRVWPEATVRGGGDVGDLLADHEDGAVVDRGDPHVRVPSDPPSSALSRSQLMTW
jgi:hypothetical protein